MRHLSAQANGVAAAGSLVTVRVRLAEDRATRLWRAYYATETLFAASD